MTESVVNQNSNVAPTSVWPVPTLSGPSTKAVEANRLAQAALSGTQRQASAALNPKATFFDFPKSSQIEIDKFLGMGHQAWVATCWVTKAATETKEVTRERYALKFFSAVYRTDKNYQQFLRSLSILQSEDGSNPYITPYTAQLYSFTHRFGSDLLLMEYISGPTFDQVITQLRSVSVNQSVTGLSSEYKDMIRHFMMQILSFLDVFHSQNIAYRDLKGENIVIDENGWIRFVDFDMVKRMTEDSRPHTPCGSSLYGSPEVLGREPKPELLSDMWSFGVLLYFALYNAYPFSSNNFEQLRKEVCNNSLCFPGCATEEEKVLLSKLLVKNPEERATSRDAMSHSFFAKFAGINFNNPVILQQPSPYKKQLEEVVRHLGDRGEEKDVSANMKRRIKKLLDRQA
ncbi:serine/threonine-protein kinase [Simkania negevensis]|uniref:non-specific serine/threonine protein kinase n=1 Tax=Simkania negevensis TaxID=83561 RepID=A0ABS3AQC7_9BACT|nr:serine/threonine-protein kinase [Simkania negevensis]